MSHLTNIILYLKINKIILYYIMSQLLVIKLPNGSPAPSGYTFVRTIRGMDIYNKRIQKVTQNDFNELDDLFKSMNVNAQPNMAVVPDSTFSDAFIDSFAAFTMGGKRNKKSKRMKSKRMKTKKRKYT